MKNSKIYWCILLFFIFLLPLGINALYLYDAWSTIFEVPSEWTKFWGGYLPSIFSSIVAFVILHIQRKDNEQENKANRQQNKIENEANRKLAIYQIEKQRIEDFRNIYTQYMTYINTNDLLELAFQIKQSNPIPTLIQNLRKPCDDFKKANILISLYPLNDNPNTKIFIQKKNEFTKSYHSILNDFHQLISWSDFPTLTFANNKSEKLENISADLEEIIKNAKIKSPTREFIYECGSTLVKKHAEGQHEKMCAAIQDYIENELKELNEAIKQD